MILRTRSGRLFSLAVLCLLVVAAPTAQELDGVNLAGEWVRVDSNNPPNNGMRITI